MRFKKFVNCSIYTTDSLEAENFEVRVLVGESLLKKVLHVKYVNIVGKAKIIQYRSFQRWVSRKSAKFVGYYNSKKKVIITLTKLAKIMVKPLMRSFDYYSICKKLVTVTPIKEEKK